MAAGRVFPWLESAKKDPHLLTARMPEFIVHGAVPRTPAAQFQGEKTTWLLNQIKKKMKAIITQIYLAN